MKKLLTGIAVALFACALAAPASAEVDAVVYFNVTKDVDINVDIQKFKDVEIFVFFDETGEGSAEALAMVNQENKNNEEIVDLDGSAGFAIDSLDAEINNSVNNNVGVTQVNQDVGVGANQANVLALAVTDAENSFADAETAVDQVNKDNTATLFGPFTPNDPERTALIQSSVNDNQGVTQVNQNAGNNVNQVNAAAVALGDDAAGGGAILALADAFLGQVNSGNSVFAQSTGKSDVIADSVLRNSGVTSVNQASGNNINQGTVVSFAGIAALGLGGNVAQIP